MPNAGSQQPPGRGKTRRWKRTAILALLLLAGGAIVNVAVAWWCAAFGSIPATRGLDMPDARQEVLWHAHQPKHLNSRVRMTAHSQSPVLDAHFMIGNASRTMNVHFDERGKVRSFGWEGRADEIDPRPFEWSLFVQSGWPVRCLTGARWSEQWAGSVASVQAALAQPRADTSEHLVRSFLITRSGGSEHRLLPFAVLLPGFIINTLFYALLPWLLSFAPFAVRRMIRRKRGQCEKCAYPIGTWGTPVCTECGAAVPARRR